MAGTVNPVPERYGSVTPNLVFHNAAKAIEFYKKAFGATELPGRAPGPNGTIMHAELQIGDSIIFVNDTHGKTVASAVEAGHSTPLYLHLYVPDVDAVFKSAIAEGARVEMPVQDMFWGDRYGKLTDPFGHQWGVATHKEDVSPEEIARRQAAFFAKSAGGA
jgi:PhnB protein